MKDKVVSRQDAFNGENWEMHRNSGGVYCDFVDQSRSWRAEISAEALSHCAKAEDLEPLIKDAIRNAKEVVVPTVWPIPGSFMQMSSQLPPVHKAIMDNFRIDVSHTVFTFGDVLHNPAGVEISEDFIRHEECHAEQQGHSPEGAGQWWARYMQDPYFRIEQEAKAFAAQYDWWCKQRGNKDRNKRNRKLIDLAQRLAAPTYGNVVNADGAKKLIKQYSKTV